MPKESKVVLGDIAPSKQAYSADMIICLRKLEVKSREDILCAFQLPKGCLPKSPENVVQIADRLRK